MTDHDKESTTAESLADSSKVTRKVRFRLDDPTQTRDEKETDGNYKVPRSNEIAVKLTAKIARRRTLKNEEKLKQSFARSETG